MRKADVKIGEIYWVKVSGKPAKVKLDCAHPAGGWFGTNTATGRQIRIYTAAKLRGLVPTQAELAALAQQARDEARAIQGPYLSYRAGIGTRYSAVKRGARLLFATF